MGETFLMKHLFSFFLLILNVYFAGYEIQGIHFNSTEKPYWDGEILEECDDRNQFRMVLGGEFSLNYNNYWYYIAMKNIA